VSGADPEHGVPYERALEAWRAPAGDNPVVLDATTASDVLRAFHPDFQEDGMMRLRVGPSAGARCPRGLAVLLEANAVVQDVDVAGAPVLEADVLVIGGGGAGTVAALEAARAGARVLVASKLRVGDGNTVMAEGGIQAAVGADDSLQRHFDDTWRGGGFRGDPELVKTLVAEGPAVIRWLIQEGMSFDLEEGTERLGGRLRRARPGGATAARLLSFRDLTGLELMRVVREALLLQPGVDVLEAHAALELLTDEEGRCAGAVLFDLERGHLRLVRAPSTLLATGGAGRLHLEGAPTSNHFGATGDGLVLAYRAGVPLRDIDSFQYHPTGLAWPKHLEGALISEAARTAGARLRNGHGHRFVEELAPRDVVASAILRELAEGRGVRRDGAQGVFLDTPELEQRQPGVLAQRLVTLSHLAARAGVDPRAEPLLVRPTLHYQNGGVAIDANGATCVPGLWCAGELVGGIHGRNRLMGNALLELVVFGRRAGHQAALGATARPRSAGLAHLAAWERALMGAGLPLDVRAPIVFSPQANFDVAAQLDRQRRHP